jgi:hypothetical protein
MDWLNLKRVVLSQIPAQERKRRAMPATTTATIIDTLVKMEDGEVRSAEEVKERIRKEKQQD